MSRGGSPATGGPTFLGLILHPFVKRRTAPRHPAHTFAVAVGPTVVVLIATFLYASTH